MLEHSPLVTAKFLKNVHVNGLQDKVLQMSENYDFM